MRLLAITPICVSDDELARRQSRYDRFSPPGVNVSLQNLGTGSEIPRALDTAEGIAASEAALVRRFGPEDGSGIDAFLPDCVLDPAVDYANASFARPVYGILKLTAHYLVSQNMAFGAVARNHAIAGELDRKLVGYGLAGKPGLTSVLGLSVDDIADEDIWSAATDTLLRTSNVDAVINGCSAVEVHALAGAPALIDPTATALRLIGLIAAEK